MSWESCWQPSSLSLRNILFYWPRPALPCIVPCTLNTGTDTCKSDIQHCNTPLTSVCDWEKIQIRGRGCRHYLRLLPDIMAAPPVWHPAHILLGPAAAAHINGAGHPKA